MSDHKPQVTQVRMDPSLPVVDASQLEPLLASSGEAALRDLAEVLLSLFSADTTRSLGRLEAACSQQDAAALADIVHSIGGSAGNLGLVRLSRYFGDFERTIRAGTFTEYAVADETIRREIDAALKAFRECYGL